MVDAEVAEEAGVGGAAAPALADERGAGEGGGLRGQAEEALGGEVVGVGRRVREGGMWDVEVVGLEEVADVIRIHGSSALQRLEEGDQEE